MRNVDKRAIIKPAPPVGTVPLRGPSGRLYGYFDPEQLVIEFKNQRSGQRTDRQTEIIDLKPLLKPGT